MYVGDILAIYVNSIKIIDEIHTTFKFNYDNIEIPSSYLGETIMRGKLMGKHVGLSLV